MHAILCVNTKNGQMENVRHFYRISRDTCETDGNNKVPNVNNDN